LFVLTSGIIFLDSISHVPFAFLRFREKSKQFINIKIVNVLLTFGLNIYFVAILKKGISGIFISNFIASLVTTIILYLLILPSVRFLFDFKKAKSMVNFGIPFIPAGLSATTMQMIDRYILKNLTDISTVGIYSAGYKLGIFMLLITSAFYYAWQPFFLKMGKKEESRPIFARVFTYFIAITSFLWILVSAFIHELIHFKLFGFSILGPEYYDCESIIPIILLAYIFQGVYLNFLPGIYFEKKTKYITIFCGLGALVNVLLNFILIPLFGILGAAFATLAGFVVLSFSTYWVSQKLFYVPYEWKRVLIIVFAWTISSFLIFISSGSILIKLLAVSLLPIFLTLLRFFEKEELNFLKNRGKSA
ncbi:polysaccharide biosynthesis C-terminal domain-containing protein, partial [candidate division KSB1 bacterium]|nr:polysaccharide biosynthesis C-terminal domain-containing protein [candidate division KSB1 bacterium]